MEMLFSSLVFAGVTSLISVPEVIVAAVPDKLGRGRIKASVSVSVLAAAVPLAFFPAARGLYVLDTSDAFFNSFGITLGALVTVLALAWFVPLALIYMMSSEFISKISTTYEGYPDWFVGLFGWGKSGALVVLALVLTFIPWSRSSKAHRDPEYGSLVEKEAKEEAL